MHVRATLIRCGDDVAMGLISKLFKSNPPEADAGEPAPIDVTTADAEAAALSISTPVVMPAYVPADARPTPTEVFDRATVLAPDQGVVEDRPTMVMPEATAAVLAKATAAASAPKPPVPRASVAVARSEPRPASPPKRDPPKPPPLPSKPPPVPRPRSHISGTVPRPALPARHGAPEAPALHSNARAPAASELDAGFAAIEAKDRSAGAGTLETDLTDVRTLFGQLATNHMRQVRDFMIELRWGPTPATWVAVCEPSVDSLRAAAEKLEFATLASALRDFASAMTSIDLTSTSTIDGDARERILAAHAALVGVLPETFGLDGDRSQREAAILHALLSQIPDVRKVTIDKLYAAGLTTLETMLLATGPDLVATTGIPEVLAERIVERFARYREEMTSMQVDETRAHERARIGALVEQLRRQNDTFEEAATAWTDDAIQRKRDALLARGQTMLEIDLQLARIGEVALVRELERLPYARKVLKLSEFLAEADSTYARGHSAA